MTKKERFQYIIDYFSVHQPAPETELAYTNPYELIVAVILSAQCTDKRVNQITPALFDAFPDFGPLSRATFDDVFPLIRSCSYPNNKTKHLINMANMVMTDFRGELPVTVEELVKLPGVGRKTANVLTSVLYDMPSMAVDTHVFRVSARIGLTTNARNPLQAEKQLVRHLPDDIIPKAHHWLILHGRYTCKARTPLCDQCGLTAICKYFAQQQKKAAKQ